MEIVHRVARGRLRVQEEIGVLCVRAHHERAPVDPLVRGITQGGDHCAIGLGPVPVHRGHKVPELTRSLRYQSPDGEHGKISPLSWLTRVPEQAHLPALVIRDIF